MDSSELKRRPSAEKNKNVLGFEPACKCGECLNINDRIDVERLRNLYITRRHQRKFNDYSYANFSTFSKKIKNDQGKFKNTLYPKSEDMCSKAKYHLKELHYLQTSNNYLEYLFITKPVPVEDEDSDE